MKNQNQILVIKMRYIGDTVLITPLLKALKTGIPNAQVDALVNKGTHQVLADNPFMGNTLIFDYQRSKSSFGYSLKLMKYIRNKKYDTVIDLTNNDRASLFTLVSGARRRIGYTSDHLLRRKFCYTDVIDSILGKIHTVDHHLKPAQALGITVTDYHPSIAVSEERIFEIEKMLLSEGLERDEPYVVIHPGARRWYKSWPPDRFARLGDRIFQEFGSRVIISGGEADLDVCSRIVEDMKHRGLNLAGRVALSDLPALIKKAVCLVGNDSAAIHIATAVKTPAIALFGPTDWKAWYPRRAHDKVIAVGFPCRPCGHSRADCHLGSDYCMGHISEEDVWANVKKTIQKA